jgi:hypothetical protein
VSGYILCKRSIPNFPSQQPKKLIILHLDRLNGPVPNDKQICYQNLTQYALTIDIVITISNTNTNVKSDIMRTKQQICNDLKYYTYMNKEIYSHTLYMLPHLSSSSYIICK